MPAAPVINHRILAVAGSGSGSGSGSAGPKPDDFDPKSPLTSYIDHRACGPRGDDAKADTSVCPDGRAMVIKKQSIEKDADGGWEVIHTDVDGCEYFAYTIYECGPRCTSRHSRHPSKIPPLGPTLSSHSTAYRDTSSTHWKISSPPSSSGSSQ